LGRIRWPIGGDFSPSPFLRRDLALFVAGRNQALTRGKKPSLESLRLPLRVARVGIGFRARWPSDGVHGEGRHREWVAAGRGWERKWALHDDRWILGVRSRLNLFISLCSRKPWPSDRSRAAEIRYFPYLFTRSTGTVDLPSQGSD
jgi:hypothetical protein